MKIDGGGKSVWMLVQNVANHFAGTTMFISRAISKSYLRKIPEI